MTQKTSDDESPAATLFVSSPAVASLQPNRFTVAGKANPRAPVIAAVHDLWQGSIKVDAQGNWSQEIDARDYQGRVNCMFANDGDHVTHSFHVQNFSTIPTITKPVNGETVAANGKLRVEGKALSDAIITIKDSRQGELGTAIPGTLGIWHADVEAEPGEMILTVTQANAGTTDPSLPVKFMFANLTPSITYPASGSLVPTTFNIKGNGGLFGAEVRVFLDTTEREVGKSATLTGDSWEASVKVVPGPVSLVAQRFLVGGSERGVPRAFKVRPPEPIKVDVVRIDSTTVKFSGTGHYDENLPTRIKLTVVRGSVEAPSEAIVNNDHTWEALGTDWPFGSYGLEAVQQISDKANGWIGSTALSFAFADTLPDPIEFTYTKTYTPVFSGKGVSGATVKLHGPDNVTKVAPDALVTNGLWSTTASQVWGPTSERAVHIRQYWGDQESPEWKVLSVDIPPTAPDSLQVIENGLSPQITGTCWPGAVVTLEYNNDGKKHHPIVTNDRWTFRRPEPFESGVTHTFSVFQTVAPQSSAAATGNFTVRKAMLKPEITVPAEGAEVGRNTLISGTNGMSGATMTVRDAQRGGKLNDKLLLSDGDWSLELENLIHNDYILDAIQTLDGIDSLPSEPRACKVVLLPPVVSVPVEGGDLPRRSTLSGTGWPTAQVSVWLEGLEEPLLRDVVVNALGEWSAQVSLDDVGDHVLRAEQKFIGNISRSLRRACRVVPSAPFIESPIRKSAIGSAVVVSGFGYPGDTVAVALASGTALGTSQVLEEGTWSVSACIEHPGGTDGLTVVASRNGYTSPPSDPHPLHVNTWLPTIDEPAAGRWVSQPGVFAGRGKEGVGQVVSWFNPEVVWAADLPVIDGQWRGEASQSPPPGGNWCRFRQSITADTNPLSGSDWAESERFEVRPPSLGDIRSR